MQANSPSHDCETQLANVRARLVYLKESLSESGGLLSSDSAQIQVRDEVRLKGFTMSSSKVLKGKEDDETFVGGERQRRLRRTSISGQAEGVKDRIIRTFNLNEKRGMEVLRENGYCRTPEQTARFFLQVSNNQ